MEQLSAVAASILPGIQLLIGVLAIFFSGALAGYVVRGWREPAEGRRSNDLSASLSTTRPAKRPTPPAEPAPAATAAASAPPASTGRAFRGRGTNGGKTVLVADDRPEMLAVHATYLERHGFGVITATDGETALALARSERPAVIVLDHSMPGRTGIEVTRELKADPATAAIPILLLTAHSYGAVGTAARAAGCAAFLPKPCEPSRVLQEVVAHVAPA